MTEAELDSMGEQARGRLPIKRILEESGSGPRGQGETWKSFKCPVCGNKAATVFQPAGKAIDLFKCFHVPCGTGNVALNEVTLLAELRGVSTKDAWRQWVKEAGVWKEERLAPSVLPGSSRRKKVDPLAQVVPDRTPAPRAPSAQQGAGGVERGEILERSGGTSQVPPLKVKTDFAGDTEGNAREATPVPPMKPEGRYETPNNNQGESIPPETSKTQGQSVPEASSAVLARVSEKPPVIPPKASGTQGESPASRIYKAGSGEQGAGSGGEDERPAEVFEQAAALESMLQDERVKGDEQAANLLKAVFGAGSEEAGSGERGAGSKERGAGGSGGGGGGGSFGGGGGGGGRSGDDGDEGAKAALALLDFYDALTLTLEDEAQLMVDRGLTAETCARLGFKSSRKENRDILFALERKYPARILAKAGLWVWHETERKYKPNAQLTGWGVKGKKAKARAREDAADIQDAVDFRESELEWDWTNPVIIPYVDLAGGVFHLRPHKGMQKGKHNRFYVVRPLKTRTGGQAELAVITEGEFKADALWQVLAGRTEGGVAVGALPGISNGKNQAMRSEILAWLRWTRPRRVVIAYDNEEKGDPKYPKSYKEDMAKRFDTQVWALVLAGWLRKQGFEATVAWLPNAWRDEKNGKADWDGVLARRIKEEKGAGSKERGVGTMPQAKALEEVYHRIAPVLAKEWLDVLENGCEPDMEGKLFEAQEERIIRNKVARLLHEPRLPYGGDKEFELALAFERLGKMSNEEFEYNWRARTLSECFRSVLGTYYNRIPAKFGDKEKLRMEKLAQAAEAEGVQNGNFDKYNFYKELMAGMSNAISDFKLDCKFVLIKPNSQRERIVSVYSKNGRNRMAGLDSKSWTAPRDFRKWLADNGNFTWLAGERELQALQWDVHHTSRYLDVHEVTWFGWHHEEIKRGGASVATGTDSRLWFADDCAITPEGKYLLPDKDGVIWWNGLGYLMSEKDWEGNSFGHGRPKWRPDEGLRMHPDFTKENRAEEVRYQMREGEDDMDAVQDLFQEFSGRISETLGSRADAYLIIGSIMAFGAAPEFFEREKWFSGVFLHGAAGSGKSTLGSWLMRLWGYRVESGKKITESTVVGLRILAQQYCNMPIWLEEYQSSVEPVKVEFVKSLYMRESATKKEMGEQSRIIRTNALITGEATATNPAMYSRYPHVQVSEKARTEMEKATGRSHKQWFQENQNFFFALGRYALRNRPKYMEAFFRHFKEWEKLEELRNVETRTRGVYGVGYAGFMAMAELLRSHVGKELLEFRRDLATTANRAVRDVRQEVNINQFWQVLIEAWKLGEFGTTANEKRAFFKVQWNLSPEGHPPGAPTQKPGMNEWCYVKPWRSYRLFIDYGAVLAKIGEFLRRQNKTLNLPQRDLRDQMSKEPYWVSKDGSDGRWKQRLMGKGPTSVWCVDLDRHPMGYQPVSDEELQEARHGLPSDEGCDPRMGDLYLIALDVEEEASTGALGGLPKNYA